MANSRVEKWRRWLDGRILDEVTGMYFTRVVYRNTTEIVASNDNLPNSVYWDYFRETYAVTQSIAVRRQAEVSSRVCSLGSLINELADFPESITRESWLQNFKKDSRKREASGFNRFAEKTGSHLDASIPKADGIRLKSVAEEVKVYVDQYLAHSDLRPEQVNLTFPDLESAMDVVGEMYSKYSVILTGAERHPEPILDPTWLAIFQQPWLTDEIMRQGVPKRSPS